MDENVLLVHLLCLVWHRADEVFLLAHSLRFLHDVRLLHVACDFHLIHQLHLIAPTGKPLEATRLLPLVFPFQLW